MKTFKEYLAENKKSYPFRLKIAGDVPKNFVEDLKNCIGKANPTIVEKSTTPIQSVPLDFPELTYLPVTTFEIMCEYPITAPELQEHVKWFVPESHFRVRNGNDAGEIEHNTADAEPDGKAMLEEPYSDKVKHKDYFGDDFNKSFLKDLQKTSKARKKDQGQTEYKLPKAKIDKAGTKSPMGS